MAKHIRKSESNVSYSEAHRVRARLLTDENPTLTARERDTVLQILTDVFPIRRQTTARRRPQSHQRRAAYRQQRVSQR